MFNYFTRQTKLKGWAAEHVIKYQPYASTYYYIMMLLNVIETHYIHVIEHPKFMHGMHSIMYVLLLTQR